MGASTSATPHSASVGSSSDTRRRFAPTNPSMSSASNRFASESPGLSESPFSQPPNFMAASREEHALREHSFIQNTESALDDFIAQGRAVLDDLVDQRNVLKGTRKRLLDAANTLGMSRDVIGWIERRRFAFFNILTSYRLAVLTPSFSCSARRTCTSLSLEPSSRSSASI